MLAFVTLIAVVIGSGVVLAPHFRSLVEALRFISGR
jgi:hypothetical protein